MCLTLALIEFLKLISAKSKEKSFLKVALCTMGKRENLYSKEYINYYIKLGIDHLFIYDHNTPNTEKIADTIPRVYLNKVTVYEASQKNITNQAGSFTDCYRNNKYFYDWFLMVDMDEYLFIVNDSLKHYLSRSIFNKCDIIAFNWALAKDNDLLYYDKRPLFERFKGPYIKSEFIKSMVRGNIDKLKYSVHSPSFAPERKITCNNEGKKLNTSKIEIESIIPISIKDAYIIHFRYKSTEEFISKYKRGYSNWFGDKLKSFLYVI